MAHKIKPIDISIVSAYLGRFPTAIVAALVFAITFHALFAGPGMRAHRTFRVAVAENGAPPDFYQPLATLLAYVSGRAVDLVPCNADEGGCAPCELYLVPALDAVASGLEIVAGTWAGDPSERAVFLAAAGTGVAFDSVSVDDIIFASPTSVNGCWAQMDALERLGRPLPATIDDLDFAASRGTGPGPIWAVVLGDAPLAACRASDVDAFGEETGLNDAVTVVRSAPALPEMVLACHSADRAYIEARLRAAELVLEGEGGAGVRDSAALLRDRGIAAIHPMGRDQMRALERVRALARRMEAGSSP